MVTILDVEPRSRAARAGVLPGDVLLAINGKEIRDVLDYRFFLATKTAELHIERPSERRTFSVSIHKEEYDDIGLLFETPLMDKKHCCENKCIFCFIDQLPRGMRKTLYFKDDDSRLSFLHGNYITLTNLHDEDISRIIEMHISPVNISVHTTNPELRVMMTHNKRAGEVLAYMERLARANISLNCQIVLCKGINDGAELDRTLGDLARLAPAVTGVSVVPAGLTKYRDKLYPLSPYTKEEARRIIAQVDEFAAKCKENFGTRLVFCADEFYLRAELPLPKEDYYEDYGQIENGVGMITSLVTEFEEELPYLDEYLPSCSLPREVSVVTGVAAYGTMLHLCRELEDAVDGLTVHVHCVINRFFGESITVSGLLVGRDIGEQLTGKRLGDEVLFPPNALRAEGDVFLDDLSPEDLSQQLGVPFRPSGRDGAGLLRCLLGV